MLYISPPHQPSIRGGTQLLLLPTLALPGSIRGGTQPPARPSIRGAGLSPCSPSPFRSRRDSAPARPSIAIRGGTQLLLPTLTLALPVSIPGGTQPPPAVGGEVPRLAPRAELGLIDRLTASVHCPHHNNNDSDSNSNNNNVGDVPDDDDGNVQSIDRLRQSIVSTIIITIVVVLIIIIMIVIII